MRILQINKLYSPWIGGIETVAANIAEHLNAVDGTTVTNLVCQAKGKRQCDTIDGVKTYRAASWGMLSGMPISWDFFRMFRELAKEADLIILHHPFPLGVVAYCAFGMNKKLVVWYHSDIIRQRLSRIPFLPFIRRALSAASSVIVSSRAISETSETLRDFREKCRVIYFAVDVDRYKLSDTIRVEAEKIRNTFGEPLILSVGRLVYYKGFSYLVQAMKEVSAHLLIIGAGPLKTYLSDEIADMGLCERVHIIDPVIDLVPYYHACDVFVLPSCEPSETFGVVQMEALACGKPVINTNLPSGVPEVSVEGRTGRTVPAKDASALADALQRTISDKEEYRRLSKNALHDAETRFSKKRFGMELERYILMFGRP